MNQLIFDKNKFPYKIITGWDDGKNVYLVHRNEKGEKALKKIWNYPWYFAVDGKYYSRILKLAEQLPQIKVEAEGDYVKIYVSRLYTDMEFRDQLKFLLKSKGIEPLEMDCSVLKRFMIDNNAQIDENLKIGFVDIETDDTEKGIVIGRNRIISFAFCDREGNTFFYQNIDEFKVLNKFVEEATKYDLLCGWNSEDFDFPYLKARMSYANIFFDWKRVIEFDLMRRFIKLFGPSMVTLGIKSFSLEDVSQAFLNKGKVKHTEKIIELEKNNLPKLEEYNKEDVRLLYELDKRLLLFDLIIKECSLTGTTLNRFYVGELLDNYILREARKQGKYLGTKPDWSIEREKIKGAYVLKPEIGLHNNVRVFDFKSMYPSIILSLNISHDTLDTEKRGNQLFGLNDEGIVLENEEIQQTIKEGPKDIREGYTKAPNGYYYSKSQGIYSGLAKRLLDMRKGYKKQQSDATYGSLEFNNAKAMQEVVKELANSMYGITADPNSRFFKKEIAESITLGGQYMLRISRFFFEEMGYKVLYQDTDSLFVSMNDKETIEPVLKEVNKKLEDHMKKFCNITEDYIIEIQYEKTFDPLLLVEKKHYVGLMTEMDDKPVNSLYTRGLEMIKKDTIGYTKKWLKVFVDELIINRKGVPFFTSWIDERKKEIFEGSVPEEISLEDITITKKMSKPLSEYKSLPLHVRLAVEMIKRKEILEPKGGKNRWGEKIDYIIFDEGKHIVKDTRKGAHRAGKMDGCLVKDFDNYLYLQNDKGEYVMNYKGEKTITKNPGEWDRTYYWNIQIYNIFMRMLKAAFKDYDWEQFKDNPPKKVKKGPTLNQPALFDFIK